MQRVEFPASTRLERGGYDAAMEIMELVFRSTPDVTYVYDGIPPEKWAGLCNAPSAGHYFHVEIRGRYPFHKRERR